MLKFIKLISSCLPIRTENIDTDQIMPARFLKITSREGFGKYLFYDWRFDKNGKPKKNPYFHGLIDERIKILVVGNNFGCGSSREHAVWALQDIGFKAIISSSFGNIFYNNSLKGGLLPIVIKPAELKNLFHELKKHPQTLITVDLANQKVTFGHPLTNKDSNNLQNIPAIAEKSIQYEYTFPIDNFRKKCLINGADELGYILSHEKQIKDFETRHKIYITA